MASPRSAETDRWMALTEGPASIGRFDPDSVDHLPGPARRHLRRVLPRGAPLHRCVEIEAVGRIRFGTSWWPFRSRQLLRAGRGFVWEARARRGPLVMRGTDSYVDGAGSMDFRLHGLVPVARASGHDVDRSAAGRLAAETVVWLPQVITPQAGAVWTAVDDERALVTVSTPTEPIDVEISVDADGRLLGTRTMRWRSTPEPARACPFGGPVTTEHVTADGVRIAGAGSVGWGWETPQWPGGEFFRFRVRSAHAPAAPAGASRSIR